MLFRRLGPLILAGLIVYAPAASAKKNHKPASSPPTDSIEVVGHIPLVGGPIADFVSTQHYSSYYLYAEHVNGEQITLTDVTRTAYPAVLADVPYMPGGGAEGLVAVAGTAALVSQGKSASKPAAPETVRIMDFSDPQHPKVAREFAGVTAIGRDNNRGLVFIANPEGIWILQQNLATDPQVEEEYAHHVLYDH